MTSRKKGHSYKGFTMEPREMVEAVLLGGSAGRVPFTVYECMLPQCAAERRLRNEWVCIVQRQVPVVTTTMPHVNVTTRIYTENGKTLTRTDFETPYGTVYAIDEAAGFTAWHHKRLFGGPEDYKALLFMIEDEQYTTNYGAFEAARHADGGDSIFPAGVGSEPLQTLISYYMGAETFCMEWYDNRDEVLKLYDAIVRNRRRLYPLLADSPALAFNYGGNVAPEIMGLDRFEQYYVPHYNEAADVLHAKGKLLGCHFDANCREFASAIANSKLDYIEAFTPAPDTDMTLAEARAAWPDKTLWINFPSSVHLSSPTEIAETTESLLAQIDPAKRFIIGITEDVPEERWRENLLAISQVLVKHTW